MAKRKADDEIDYTNPDYLPMAKGYADLLKGSGKVTTFERDVLLAHYAAPGHVARNAIIAEALSTVLQAVNGAYGRLGSKLISHFRIDMPSRAIASHALSWFEHGDDGFYYATLHNRPRTSVSGRLISWASRSRPSQ